MESERKYVRHNPLCTLESFVIDPASQANIAKVDELLKADFLGTDVLVIRSDQGCGGSHLLYGVAHALESPKKKLICLSSEWIKDNLLSDSSGIELERKGFLEYLNTSSYLLIDDFSAYGLVEKITMGQEGKWLGDALIDFISSGGKLICTHADTDHKHSELLHFLVNFNIWEVYLKRPGIDVLEKIVRIYFSSEVVARNCSNELYEKCSSVRDCVNILSCLAANQKLYGLDKANNILAKRLGRTENLY